MEMDQLSNLSRDLLLEEILTRVDGPTLASVACVCIGLHKATQEETLWKELCHSTWPSTMEKGAQTLISTSPGGFSKFYSDSLPLILYKPHPEIPTCPQTETQVTPSDLVSLVDVYYKNRCVLSRVVHGIPEHDPSTWFLECPFKLEVLSTTTTTSSCKPIPSILDMEGGAGELNTMTLEADIRLSWVLLDVKSGRSVNLSTWKPTFVLRNWPSNGDLLMRFGSAVPVEEQLLPCSAAECVISVRCRVSEREGQLRWMEIGLQVEDMEGQHIRGHGSLAVLGRALGCRSRTRDHGVVEEGYRVYTRDRKVRRERKMRREGLADKLCALGGIVVFAAAAFLTLEKYKFLLGFYV